MCIIISMQSEVFNKFSYTVYMYVRMYYLKKSYITDLVIGIWVLNLSNSY